MEVMWFGLISFCTSLITGVIGVGGGLLLIAILPHFLPTNALIPVHGLTQIASNVSRTYFGWKDVQLEVVPKFFIGSLLGVSVFTLLLNQITLSSIPLLIGVYILVSLWSPWFNAKIMKYENYYLIGFLQTGLSVVVGTTGQLAIAKLLKDFNDANKVVATSALLMSITHLLKSVVFIYFGFVFFDYAGLIFVMMIGSVLGSYAGTKLRHKLESKTLMFLLKLLLSALALKSIVKTIFAG
ncbi:sulfite exporter TauE/SafE family protein [Sulfurospirillum barnesii]|uniref:Probable membrane transporter protein n=1 Tax=Sulfurospirillum barnesii (strain ATCC 700032 / DSM 10660 / SES-3) TaxID=760154 RepID=I3XVS2_SULBS|nr:sulfite exporter TauE/SafE family protein [Sulfurospirillum barnesii]AFL68046.1 putative permease [Sulfurospirillum barnesii SES-3]